MGIKRVVKTIKVLKKFGFLSLFFVKFNDEYRRMESCKARLYGDVERFGLIGPQKSPVHAMMAYKGPVKVLL